MANTKKTIKITVSILLCLLFLIYVVYHIANSFKEKTELFLVTRVTEENVLDVSGYIFRDETVMYSGMSGICTYSRENGEKVAKDSAVANSYFVNSDELEQKINTLNYKIEVLEKSGVSDSSKLAVIDAQIAELRTEIAQKIASGNTAFVESAEKDLLILLHQRTLVDDNNENYNSELTILRAERTLLLSSLSGSSKEITAAESGYFYSYTDGYEDIFTAEAAENMTIDSFKSLTQTSAIPTSGAVGKIAADFKWYFVCETTTEKSAEIMADKYYECVFMDNAHDEKLKLFAEKKIVDYTTGEVVLVFSCTTIPQDFDFSRVQRAKITFSQTSGLRVPVSSVRVIDGQTSVYVMKKGVCRIKQVNILFEKDGYCVVSEPQNSDDLAVYDRIVLGEKDLYDGKVIGY